MSKKKEAKVPDKEKKYTREEHDALTRFYLQPEFQAGFTLSEIIPSVSDPEKGTWKADTNAIINTLKEGTDKLRTNNLAAAEDMLLSQAQVLDVLFNKYILMAGRSEYMNSLKIYSEIAFKAQRQCRASLEALAEIKNPKPYIQNNKAHYQQVNNGTVLSEGNNSNNTRTHAHAGENQKSSNGLLEDKTHEQQWLDAGAPETAGRNDKELETVGAQHRAKD